MNCQSCQCAASPCTNSAHDENTSEWMTLSDVARKIPRRNGKRVNTSTIWRWCRKGVRGVHLKYAKIGRNIVVSPSDLHAFFETLAEADSADQSPTTATRKRKPRRRVNNAVRQREIDAANAVLIKAGILAPTETSKSRDLR